MLKCLFNGCVESTGPVMESDHKKTAFYESVYPFYTGQDVAGIMLEIWPAQAQ